MVVTHQELERALLALASASVVSMRQTAAIRAALDGQGAGPPATPVASVRRTTESMIAYQRGYQAALLDVARAAGCPGAMPGTRPGLPPHVPGRARREASSLAEFLEAETLALGICVRPGWDV